MIIRVKPFCDDPIENSEVKPNNAIKKESATLFGIFFPEIFESQTKISQLFWPFVYITSLITFSLQFYPLIKKYQANEITTSFQIKYSDGIEFPQVTICSNSFLQKYKIRNVLMANLYQLPYIDELQSWESENGSYEDYPLHQVDLNRSNGNSSEYDWQGLYQHIKYSRSIPFSDFEKYLIFEPRIPFLYGTNYEDIVVSCIYENEKCNKSHFDVLLNDHLGKCYILNSAKSILRKKTNLLETSTPGRESGLRIIFFVNENERIGLLGKASGISLSLNYYRSHPLPDLTDLIISSGVSAKIPISRESLFRLHRKSSPCTDVVQPDKFLEEVTKKWNGENFLKIWDQYDKDTCYDLCMFRNMLRTCGCVKRYYFTYSINGIPYSPFTICNPWNETLAHCILKFSSNFSFKENCFCPLNCKQITYNFRPEISTYPSSKFLYYFIDDVLNSTNAAARGFARSLLTDLQSGKINKEQMLEKVRSNFLLLQVYYEHKEHQEIKESLAYSFPELLAAFAGNIGMYVGWSVLTFAHIMIAICNFVHILVSGK